MSFSRNNLISLLNKLSHTIDAGGRLLFLGIILITAQSLIWPHSIPISMKLVGAGVAVLAFMRPADALLIVAGLAPLGVMFSRLLGTQARGSEALVLAFLAGWTLKSWLNFGRDRQPLNKLSTPIILFGVVIVASCIEQLAWLQVQRDYPWPFIQSFSIFLSRDYLLGPGGFGFVQVALRLLEGLALFTCVTAICKNDRTLQFRMTRVLVGAAAGAALLSVSYIIMEFLQTNSWADVLASRWTIHIGDVNAAGSYFLMMSLIALSVATARNKWTLVWLSAGLVIATAFQLADSRAAIIAALCIAATIAFVWTIYRLSMSPLRVATVGILIVATMILVLRYTDLIISPRALETLNTRWLFMETTLGMLGYRPLFGVGIGQYYLWSMHFFPPELLALYPRENAHNYFFQIAGELGILGLSFFMWLIITALRSAWPGMLIILNDPRRLGILSGLAAFFLTCLTGHPLLIPEVAYPFWIILGLAVGSKSYNTEYTPLIKSSKVTGDENQLTSSRSQTLRQHNLRLVVTTSIIVFLLASVPTRVARGVSEIDLVGVAYGFYDWETEPSGTQFRWIRNQASLFVSPQDRVIEIPLGALIIDPSMPVDVDIAVNGRPANQVRLVDNSWRQVRIQLQNNEDIQFPRIDLRVSQTFRPSDIYPDNQDRRELGIRVGEISVISKN